MTEPSLTELLNTVPPPKRGGEEVRIEGFWAVLADEYLYSESLSLWKVGLMGMQVQVLAQGPVYARPVGWTQERVDEAGRPRVDYIIGVEMLDCDGSTYYWSYHLVPPWGVGTDAEGKEQATNE